MPHPEEPSLVDLAVERQLKDFASTTDDTDPTMRFDDLFQTSAVALSITELSRGSGLSPEDIIVRLNRYFTVGTVAVDETVHPRRYKYSVEQPVSHRLGWLRHLLQ